MAIGFSNGSVTFRPDKGFTRKNTPTIFRTQFGDGYEQRLANGINNLKQEFSISFATRTKADIDDIVDFFELKGGVTPFNYTYEDSNESGGEKTVKVVCDEWQQTWEYAEYYSLSCTFRRVYEA
jgi:phage-related protein